MGVSTNRPTNQAIAPVAKTAKPLSKPKAKKASKSTILKQVLGIDVSKDELHLHFRNALSDGAHKVKTTKKVPNTQKGFETIVESIKKHLKECPQGFSVLVEATGVYHENLCYYLHQQGYSVVITLGNKAKAFANSLNAKSKTDRADAEILARFGLERQHDFWAPVGDNLLQIKRLVRERQDILEERTAIKNQLHALNHAHDANAQSIKRYEERIKFCTAQMDAIEKELAIAAAQNTALQDNLTRLQTITGIAFISAICILAEANNFEGFENRNQLISYAGLDVVERQSGSSIKGKTHISKKGSTGLRRSLYFPAIAAVQHSKRFADLYKRVFDRSKITMKAYVAVQRKILLIAFALCKNKTSYSEQFLSQATEQTPTEPPVHTLQ